MLLFRTMVSRATALIVQAQLHAREQAAREEAQRSLAHARHAAGGLPVGIAFLDRELRYLRVNETLARLNGVPGGGAPGPHAARGAAAAGAVAIFEPPLRAGAGDGRALGASSSPAARGAGPAPGAHWLANYYPVRTPAGSCWAWACTVVDITAHKQAEAGARAAPSTFREQLLAVLGHDLRNPLDAISASAFLLARAEEPGRARAPGAVERIRSSAARMARMIDDILDFARSRLGGGIPVHAPAREHGRGVPGALEELQVTYPERQLLFEVRGDTWGRVGPGPGGAGAGQPGVQRPATRAGGHARAHHGARRRAPRCCWRCTTRATPIPPSCCRASSIPSSAPRTTPPRGQGGTRSLGLGLLHRPADRPGARGRRGGALQPRARAPPSRCAGPGWPRPERPSPGPPPADAGSLRAGRERQGVERLREHRVMRSRSPGRWTRRARGRCTGPSGEARPEVHGAREEPRVGAAADGRRAPLPAQAPVAPVDVHAASSPAAP